MTVDEVIEGVFVDDSEIETLYSESDSDSSEGVCSENLSAKEIGTDKYSFLYFNNTSNKRKSLYYKNTFSQEHPGSYEKVFL